MPPSPPQRHATLTVDEAAPPYSFVTISGPVEISEDLDAMLPWSIRLAGRYLGASRAEEFGRAMPCPASYSSASSRNGSSPSRALRTDLLAIA